MKKNEEYLIGGAVAAAAVGGIIYYKVTHPVGIPAFTINGQSGALIVPANSTIVYAASNLYSGTAVQLWENTTPQSNPSPTNGTQETIGSADFWGNFSLSSSSGGPGTVYAYIYDVHRGIYSNMIAITA